MNDPTPPLAGLSPVNSKRVEVRFDGGPLSCDGAARARREIEKRLDVEDRRATCLSIRATALRSRTAWPT